jgi:hypothetical protein
MSLMRRVERLEKAAGEGGPCRHALRIVRDKEPIGPTECDICGKPRLTIRVERVGTSPQP